MCVLECARRVHLILGLLAADPLGKRRERLFLRRRRAARALVDEPLVEPAVPRAEEALELALRGARDRAHLARARVGVERIERFERNARRREGGVVEDKALSQTNTDNQ